MKTLLFSSLVLFLCLSSCKEDIDGNIPPPLPPSLDCLIIEKEGVNIIDALNPENEEELYFYIEDYQISAYFDNVKNEKYASEYLAVRRSPNNINTLSIVYDLDDNIKTEDRFKKSTHIIKYEIKSEKIFGDKETHIIVVDFTFEKRIMTRTKVSLDGKEGEILDYRFEILGWDNAELTRFIL